MWKTSGTVELTRGGNPKPPNDEVVCTWVKTAWRNADWDFIMKLIARAGFHDDFEEWHISRHNIFGTRLKSIWVSNISETITEFKLFEGELGPHFCLRMVTRNICGRGLIVECYNALSNKTISPIRRS